MFSPLVFISLCPFSNKAVFPFVPLAACFQMVADALLARAVVEEGNKDDEEDEEEKYERKTTEEYQISRKSKGLIQLATLLLA